MYEFSSGRSVCGQANIKINALKPCALSQPITDSCLGWLERDWPFILLHPILRQRAACKATRLRGCEAARLAVLVCHRYCSSQLNSDLDFKPLCVHELEVSPVEQKLSGLVLSHGVLWPNDPGLEFCGQYHASHGLSLLADGKLSPVISQAPFTSYCTTR